MDEFRDDHFVVFPAFGYWEIDGKPVSSKEADYGMNPKAKWVETEVARNMTKDNAREKFYSRNGM